MNKNLLIKVIPDMSKTPKTVSGPKSSKKKKKASTPSPHKKQKGKQTKPVSKKVTKKRKVRVTKETIGGVSFFETRHSNDDIIINDLIVKLLIAEGVIDKNTPIEQQQQEAAEYIKKLGIAERSRTPPEHKVWGNEEQGNGRSGKKKLRPTQQRKVKSDDTGDKSNIPAGEQWDEEHEKNTPAEECRLPSVKRVGMEEIPPLTGRVGEIPSLTDQNLPQSPPLPESPSQETSQLPAVVKKPHGSGLPERKNVKITTSELRQELSDGLSVPEIGRKYNMAYRSLYKRVRKLSQEDLDAVLVRHTEDGSPVLDMREQLFFVNHATLEILRDVKTPINTKLQAIKRIESQNELQGRLHQIFVSVEETRAFQKVVVETITAMNVTYPGVKNEFLRRLKDWRDMKRATQPL